MISERDKFSPRCTFIFACFFWQHGRSAHGIAEVEVHTEEYPRTSKVFKKRPFHAFRGHFTCTGNDYYLKN